MKVLSVQQPYASLIAAGVITINELTWKPKSVPKRILIHATNKRASYRSVITNEPIEWFQETLNNISFGNIPDFSDMPFGAIIGYVTLDRIDQDYESTVWSCLEGGHYVWHFKDAHLFDEPITGIKGKPRLWDFDLDEDNLPPAHIVELNEFIYLTQSLLIKVSEKHSKTKKIRNS